MEEKVHESAEKMAKELLQHPVGDQNGILKQFKDLVLKDRGMEVENKLNDANVFQKFFEELKSIFIVP